MRKNQLLWAVSAIVVLAVFIVWRFAGAEHQPEADSAQTSAFRLPEGFKQVETSRLMLAVPAGWSADANGKELVFTMNGEKVGETETLDWFDAAGWLHMQPNHSEQTSFTEVTDIPSPAAGQSPGLRLYRIRLVLTKPAAQQDPDWHYDEIRWYWTDPSAKLAYGVYFNEAAVDEATMLQAVSSIRLKTGK